MQRFYHVGKQTEAWRIGYAFLFALSMSCTTENGTAIEDGFYKGHDDFPSIVEERWCVEPYNLCFVCREEECIKKEMEKAACPENSRLFILRSENGDLSMFCIDGNSRIRGLFVARRKQEVIVGQYDDKGEKTGTWMYVDKDRGVSKIIEYESGLIHGRVSYFKRLEMKWEHWYDHGKMVNVQCAGPGTGSQDRR